MDYSKERVLLTSGNKPRKLYFLGISSSLYFDYYFVKNAILVNPLILFSASKSF